MGVCLDGGGGRLILICLEVHFGSVMFGVVCI